MSKEYKPEELTADGLPTIETQLKEIEEKDLLQLNKASDKEKIERREMIQRVKCLSLRKMNKSVMTNTNMMSKKERDKLQNIMWEYNDVSKEDIIKEFNDIVNDELFENNSDITKYPIYEFF